MDEWARDVMLVMHNNGCDPGWQQITGPCVMVSRGEWGHNVGLTIIRGPNGLSMVNSSDTAI